MLPNTRIQCSSLHHDEIKFNHKVHRSADARHVTCGNWFCDLEVTLFDLHEPSESINWFCLSIREFFLA